MSHHNPLTRGLRNTSDPPKKSKNEHEWALCGESSQVAMQKMSKRIEKEIAVLKSNPPAGGCVLAPGFL